MSAKGLTQKKQKLKGDDCGAEIVNISGPFEILGACRDPLGHSWGKWLRWRDPDGRQHLRHVSDAALQGDAASLCASSRTGA